MITEIAPGFLWDTEEKDLDPIKGELVEIAPGLLWDTGDDETD